MFYPDLGKPPKIDHVISTELNLCHCSDLISDREDCPSVYHFSSPLLERPRATCFVDSAMIIESSNCCTRSDTRADSMVDR